HRRIRLAAVHRTGYRHLRAVDSVAGAEEDDDVAVVEVARAIEGEPGIGAEVDAVGPDGGWKGKIHSSPGGAAVGGEIAAHRQAEDLVRAGRDDLGVPGVDGDEGLALRTAFVGDVDVGTEGARRCRRRGLLSGGSVVEDELVLVPPGRILRIRGKGGRADQRDRKSDLLHGVPSSWVMRRRTLLHEPATA